MKERQLIHQGLITEALPNGMFQVCFENEDVILGYISGRIWCSFIRILPGDRIKINSIYRITSILRVSCWFRTISTISPDL
uniref:S1-like domain-containing protein n=1 Tax=Musa acuminata subsp. malaccensis TaxID=214687 RepID=A0A804JI91_MUSAM